MIGSCPGGALAIAGAGAALAFGPIVDATGGSQLAIATNLAYPLGDLGLLAVAIGGLAMSGWRISRGWALLMAGYILFAVSDTLYLFQIANGTYVGGLIDAGASEALRTADRRMYAQKQGRETSAGRQSKNVLIQALGERSPELVDHVHDVAELAADVARRLGLPEHELEQVRQAAELHDVGKVAVPDAILQKRGPLDDEEWSFIHQHTLIGERIISAAPALVQVAKLVRSSHERWDGTGYPDRLAGTSIPVGARIVSVCDALAAMVSDRPYREAVALPAALEELERCAGSQFDPAVVAALTAVLTAPVVLAA